MLNLLPGDKKYGGYLITYGNQPELVADTNSDPEVMVQKIGKIKPAGGSALFDAIYMACTSRKSVEGEPYEPRRVIIVDRRWPRFGQQENAAGSGGDRAAQPGDDLRHGHRRVRFPQRR